MDALAESTQKIKVLKEQLKLAFMDHGIANKELLLVKGSNFRIN